MFNPLGVTPLKKRLDRALWQVRQHIDPHSLQFRLTIGATLVAVLCIGALSGWISWRTEQILIGSHKQDAHELADRVPQDIEAYVYQDMMSLEDAIQQAINVRSLPNVALAVVDPEAQVAVEPQNNWHKGDVIQILASQNMGTAFPSVITLETQHYVVCAQPLVIDGQSMGVLHIALDVTDDRVMFDKLMQMLTLATVLAMGLMAIGIAVYVRRSLRPLRHMSQMTATLSVDELAHHQLELGYAPTEVKELARTCEQSLARLAATVERQQQFVRDISHELRTPLSIVSGYLQSLLRRSKMFTEPQREALETASAEAEHTIRLLQDLLDLERAESGHVSFKRSPIILDELVDDVVQMAIISSYRDIEVKQLADYPVEAQADPDHLKQVLAQLVDNALKYSDDEQLVTIKLNQRNARAIIQVCDRGVGIPLQHQSRIFDQCYRVDSNRSRSTGGCGVGLSLVKVLVEGMGGTVTVQSRPEEGSIFTVTLPTPPDYYDTTNRSRRRRRKAGSIHRNGTRV